MEKGNKMFIKLWLIPVFFFAVPIFANAQGFKGIVPLQSTCEDVKRILQVGECTFPQSIYRLKDFRITINFTTDKPEKEAKICFRVPAGLVSGFTVSYNKRFPVAEFEPKVKYLEGPFGDIDTIVYGNEEDSIAVFTNSELVNYIVYSPTRTERRKFSYQCKSPDAGDEVKLPSEWIDRYWNLPPKKEKAKIKDIALVIKQTEENFGRSLQIYLVYYYSRETEKKKGFEQANRAKRYLELNGIASEKLKIINGGKEDKPEIIIYFELR